MQLITIIHDTNKQQTTPHPSYTFKTNNINNEKAVVGVLQRVFTWLEVEKLGPCTILPISTITLCYHYHYDQQQQIHIFVHHPPKDRVFLFLGDVVGELDESGVVFVNGEQTASLDAFVHHAKQPQTNKKLTIFYFNGVVASISTLSAFRGGKPLRTLYHEITGEDDMDESDDEESNVLLRHRRPTNQSFLSWGLGGNTK